MKLSEDDILNRLSKTNFTLVGEYTTSRTKTKFVCKKCGCELLIVPDSIFRGSGCSKCSGNKRKTTEEYKSDLLKVNEYMVCLEEYISSKYPIKHLCKKCNKVGYYDPGYLLKKHGCVKCLNRIETTEEYNKKLLSIGKKLVCIGEYNGVNNKIPHKCDVCNFIYDVRPSNVLNENYGCSNCSKIRKKTHEEYIIDLSLVNSEMVCLGKYEKASKKILHKCLMCGCESEYTPNNLLNGQGCGKCANNQRLTTEEYKIILRSKNKKIEVLDEYISRGKDINHLCLICNSEFRACPANIISSKSDGCPSCKISSIGEKLISEYLELKNLKYTSQYKFETCRNIRQLPFDFYLSDHNICIEFDGRQHFEPVEIFGGEKEYLIRIKNDKIKSDWCLNNNVELIRISHLDIDKIYDILDLKINNNQ